MVCGAVQVVVTAKASWAVMSLHQTHVPQVLTPPNVVRYYIVTNWSVGDPAMTDRLGSSL